LHEWIREIVPRARVLEASYGQVPLELVLGVGRYRIDLDQAHEHNHDHEQSDHSEHEHHHEHDHSTEFATWSYETDRPFVLPDIRLTLQALPETIFRAKGVLWVAQVPDRTVVFQLVGQRASLVVGQPWGTAQCRSRLVCIGLPGGLDGAQLRSMLDSCLTDMLEGEATTAVAGAWVRGG
jgi:G3E family GTPase